MSDMPIAVGPATPSEEQDGLFIEEHVAQIIDGIERVARREP
jgi:hypothetical protein